MMKARKARKVHRLLTLAVLLCGPVAHAATITVNSTEVSMVNNQLCGLEEALWAVTNQAPANPANGNDCPAGNGSNDRINLPAGTINETHPMSVERSVEIVGAGINSTTIVVSGLYGFIVGARPELGQPEVITVTIRNLAVRKLPSEDQAVSGIHVVANDWANPNAYTSVYLDSVRVADTNAYGIDGSSRNSYVEIKNSIVENNPVGVAIFGATKIIGSAIVNNNGPHFADESPGVTFKGIGNSAIINSTISGNHSIHVAGGLYSEVASTGTLSVFSSTIANNTAQYAGGGIFENTTQSTNLRIYDSIIANNSIDDPTGWGSPPGPDAYGFIVSESCLFSVIDAGRTGLSNNDQINVNPQLGALVDISFPIITKVHPLLKTSPAIDKRPSIVFEAQSIDQRGYLRPIDGPDGNTTAEYDLGATEFDPNLQSEVLLVAAKTANRTHAIIVDGVYTNGKGTRFEATSNNDFVTYAVPAAKTGSHTIKARVRKGTNRGIYQVAISSSLSGPWTALGGTQDLYNASLQFADLTLGTVSFGSTGTKYVRFTVTGKHASSTGRWLYLDWIQTGE